MIVPFHFVPLPRPLGVVLVAMLLASPVLAQETSTPAPAAEEDCIDDPPRPAGVIALVAGEEILESRIEALAAPAVADLARARIEARFALLSRVIQNHLLAREAKRRGVEIEALLAEEVHDQIEAPTEIEIAQYGRRHPDRYGSDLERAHEWIVADLLTERRMRRGEAFLNSLVEGVSVEWPFEFRDPAARPEPDTIVARVDGEPITAEGLVEQWEDQEYEADQRAYFERKVHLDRLINSKLLERAADAAGTDTRTLLRETVEARFVAITDEEVVSFFEANAHRIVEPFESVRAAIRTHLEDQRRFDIEAGFAMELREGARVVTYLEEPQPPVHTIDIEGRPVLGPAEAPVTIVAFTDLRCARCRELHGWLIGLPEFYGTTIRVALRHKPLLTLHPAAYDLALAAEAARAQGKFFEFVERAFVDQGLAPGEGEDRAESWARDLGLDLERFARDRRAAEARRVVEEDLATAERLGIHRTPVVYVNGRRVPDSSLESLLRTLRREFERQGITIDDR